MSDDPTLRGSIGEPDGRALSDAAQSRTASAAGDGTALKRASGRYRNNGGPFQLELRIDIGGAKPLYRVSGDFFRGEEYLSSFHAPVSEADVQMSSQGLLLNCTVDHVARSQGGVSAANRKLRIFVANQRRSSKRKASVVFLDDAGNPGGAYRCPYRSQYFRTLRLEQDFVVGAKPLGVVFNHKKGVHCAAQSGKPRKLTVVRAYKEAGVNLVRGGHSEEVPIHHEANDKYRDSWSNIELQQAMSSHFDLWGKNASATQWKAYLLVATRHDKDTVRGFMFEEDGPTPRRGCAIFRHHEQLSGDGTTHRRNQLRTCVHELGHGLNLLHPSGWTLIDKKADRGPNGGLAQLTWMNVPEEYWPEDESEPGEHGAFTDRFWSDFRFQFVDYELIHLRHGRFEDVVMGGLAYRGLGSRHAEDNSASPDVELRLEPIREGKNFLLGEPVVVELKLSVTGDDGEIKVHRYLDSQTGVVGFVIEGPLRKTGAPKVTRYRPMFELCMCDRPLALRSGEAQYESAYLGYGRDGFHFDEPGKYRVTAHYTLPDGRHLSASDQLTIYEPRDARDREATRLLREPELGRMFCMRGYAPHPNTLVKGQAALKQLAGLDHRLSVYAQALQGVNCGRPFKHISAGKRRHFDVIPADYAASTELISRAVDKSRKDNVLDNLTLQRLMFRLARSQRSSGTRQGEEAARETLRSILPMFAGKLGTSKHWPTIRTKIETDVRHEALALGLQRRRRPIR